MTRIKYVPEAEAINYRNRLEWLEGRTKGIGGSDASAIIGKNPYKTNVDLYLEKIGEKVAEDISMKPYVRYGLEAEPDLRHLFALDYPQYKVKHHVNRIYKNVSYPFLLASLDGVLEDANGRMGVLEVKTSNILQSMQKEDWKQKVPDNYYVQLLHYLLVTGYDYAILKAHLKTEFPVDHDFVDVRIQTKHYYIERDEVLDDLLYLLEAEIKFWDCVVNRKMPDLVLPDI